MSRTVAFTENPKPKISRSTFDLSHEVLFTGFQQYLYPILVMDCIPGDIHKIGQTAVIRLQPLVAPILTGIKMKTDYYFVPYRILWDQFQDFYSKGKLGETELTTPKFSPAAYANPNAVVAEGNLWDFLGFRTGVVPAIENCPNDFLRRGYYKIWNEWFRDETLQDEYDINDLTSDQPLMKRNWLKDYFTSALPFRQKGIPVALPVVGTGSATFDLPFENNNLNMQYFPTINGGPTSVFTASQTQGGLAPGNFVYASAPADVSYVKGRVDDIFSSNNTISGTSFTATDITDFRYVMAIQSWQEKNARGGSRFTELILSQYDVFNGDDRLQRPEWIGGSTMPIIISEVLQTSSTDAEPTPQGTLAGHGIGVANGFIGSYRVTEPGCIIGMCSFTAEALYQQGINRQFSQDTTFDYMWPTFTGLSEQPILNKEIYVQSAVSDPGGVIGNEIFGFTGMYNHYRFMPSRVSGEMRSTFAYWTQSRIFAALPTLDSDFISADPRRDIFADQVDPGFLVRFGNSIESKRPLPFMPVPITLGGL